MAADRVEQARIQAEIERFARLLWRQGDVRELRVPKHNKYRQTAAGWFETPEALAAAAIRWDRRGNVFIMLNPVERSLLGRANGRVDPDARSTTSDKDILSRRWLFIDIDAERPSGISSTDEELNEARKLAVHLRDRLMAQGWPAPVVAMSGNGYYLLFPVDLPNDEPATLLVAELLAALAAEFNTATAHIDTTVSNAARIVGLVGTLKMKGDPLADRPHRRSVLEGEADPELLVTAEMVRSFVRDCGADGSGDSKSGAPFGRTADGGATSLKEILDRAGIEVRTQSPDARGFTWYHVGQCPFHDDGQPFECGVGQQLPDGPFAGHCFHPEGERSGWQEWKVALGLGSSFRSRPTNGSDASLNGAGLVDRKSTDLGNSERLVSLYEGRLKYAPAIGWLAYDGRRWMPDPGAAERAAKATARSIWAEADQLDDLDQKKARAAHAFRSESAKSISAMLTLARSDSSVQVQVAALDADPWAFNVGNGTLDLRTGELRSHDAADLVTKLSPVDFDPGATCPQWERFMQRIAGGNAALLCYLQRAVGYALTAMTWEHVLFVLFGKGSNGKSTKR